MPVELTPTVIKLEPVFENVALPLYLSGFTTASCIAAPVFVKDVAPLKVLPPCESEVETGPVRVMASVLLKVLPFRLSPPVVTVVGIEKIVPAKFVVAEVLTVSVEPTPTAVICPVLKVAAPAIVTSEDDTLI